MSDWLVLGMFVLLLLVIYGLRRDAAKSAARRTEQNEHFDMAQTKVLAVLASTEEMLATTEALLTEQQRANKILEHQNAALGRQIEEIKKQLEIVERRLEVVTDELKEVRAQLASMTERAHTAEDKAID